jgi:hypothetical protein
MPSNNKVSTEITFDSLPHAIGDILSRLERIEMILVNKSSESILKEPISTKQLCNFLNVTEPTIAKYRRKGIIPFMLIGSAIRYDLSRVVAALDKNKIRK